MQNLSKIDGLDDWIPTKEWLNNALGFVQSKLNYKGSSSVREERCQ